MEDFTGDNSRFSDWLICLDFMPAFLHCIIKPEVRSYCPELTIFWLWNKISVDLGFDYNYSGDDISNFTIIDLSVVFTFS